MIKIEELRIGNVVGLKQANIAFKAGAIVADVQDELFLCYVVGILETHIVVKVPDGYLNCTTEQLFPIPIGKNWLDGYGFKKDEENSSLFHKEDFSVWLYADRPSVMLHKCKPNNINYKSVHKLQNLFFSIKEQELRLTE